MPDALKGAHVRRVQSRRSLMPPTVATLVFLATAAWGQGRYVSFDMPARPLADALVDFANLTGMTALVDGKLASGLRSSPVKGRLTSADALRVLLAGTGLSIRYAGINAFTVGPPLEEDKAQGGAGSQTVLPVDYSAYFSRLQDAVEQVLCHGEDTRPGGYRAAFQIWVEENGAVGALHLLSSTGDESRDAAITTRLTKSAVVPPPGNIPQPFTILLQAKATGVACARPTEPHP